MHYVDGTQLAPTEFGEFNDYGGWSAIEASGLTYGNNGFYLNFSNSSDFGEDFSGENNPMWKGGSAIDYMVDNEVRRAYDKIWNLTPAGKTSKKKRNAKWRDKNKAETGYTAGYSRAKKKIDRQGVGTLEKWLT